MIDRFEWTLNVRNDNWSFRMIPRNGSSSERTGSILEAMEFLYTILRNPGNFSNWKKEKKKRKMPTVVREAIHKSLPDAKNPYYHFAKLALVFPAMQFVSKNDLIWAHTKLHSEASWFPSFWARGKKKRATSRVWKRFGWQIVLFKHAINLWLIKLL